MVNIAISLLIFAGPGYLAVFKPEVYYPGGTVNTTAWYAQRSQERKIAFWVSGVTIPLGLLLIWIFNNPLGKIFGCFFLISGGVIFIFGLAKNQTYGRKFALWTSGGMILLSILLLLTLSDSSGKIWGKISFLCGGTSFIYCLTKKRHGLKRRGRLPR